MQRNPLIAAMLVLVGVSFSSALGAPASVPTSAPAAPRPEDGRLVVELVAREPDVVTPTGIACDAAGRVWVVENNTHFQPKGYAGHRTDRILILDDFDPGGRARKIDVFTEGLKDTMSLAVRPGDEVYVVCRNQVLRFQEADGKPAGEAVKLVSLETQATYPHNGLNGITFSPDGRYIYFCLGLNTGYPYKVVGSDGSALSGGGEGGSLYRCRLDGGHVERVATGFWNVHDLTFDAFGRLFAVDNDPDDRPPCRLLDVIEGGDYGWQYRNGRKGVHPFTSWFGERAGTLPMVSPTGEAPCGIVAYESDGLPGEYRGDLLVASWGDHVIQRFHLTAKGASFTSEPQTFVQGGYDFRPVGLAVAPDGSLLVSDWVDRSYPVHGKGRVWRVRMKTPPTIGPALSDVSAARGVERLVALLADPRRDVREAAGAALAGNDVAGHAALQTVIREEGDYRARVQAVWALARTSHRASAAELVRIDRSGAVAGEVLSESAGNLGTEEGRLVAGFLRQRSVPPREYRPALLALPPEFGGLFPGHAQWAAGRGDPFLASAAITALSRSDALRRRLDDPKLSLELTSDPVVETLAFRRTGDARARRLIPRLLGHPDPAVRRAALQWVGEERLSEFVGQVAEALKVKPVTREVLEAVLAAQDKLAAPPAESGKAPAERTGRQLAAGVLLDETQDAAVRGLALELIDPNDARVSSEVLAGWVKTLGAEALRALAWREDAAAQAFLRGVAADAGADVAARRDAILGLARSAFASAETRRVLGELLRAGPAETRVDALRSLRGTLDRAAVRGLCADVQDAKEKPAAEDRREWAEQILLAVKATPDLLTGDDRAGLEAIAAPRPADVGAWQGESASGGDAEAGRRVFFHPGAGRCFTCHEARGRGGHVGPSLTGVGASADRRKIVESVVEPSKEVAPLYVPWIVTRRDGSSVTGIDLEEDGGGNLTVTDASGTRVRVKFADVASRRAEKLSIMPAGLVEGMTRREFRDLVEFLSQLK